MCPARGLLQTHHYAMQSLTAMSDDKVISASLKHTLDH